LSIKSIFRRLYVFIVLAFFLHGIAEAKVIRTNPETIKRLLPTLHPGDTMVLSPGFYAPLLLSRLNGMPGAWISIEGGNSPDGAEAAVIVGEPCCNTVEIQNSSYLSIARLRVDSAGIRGVFGISARGGTTNRVHDILIRDNVLVGQNGSQQTDGISTKTPTWNWTIRGNKIFGAGTGLYLGDSDGSEPFIGGIIENNLIHDTIGYNMEIKYQNPRPSVPGMPTGSSTTIVRNNTFIKGDEPSPDGNRPNVLIGGLPTAGPGSDDLYQIYGNFFDHNPHEALLQASGRVAIHDNLFVGGKLAAIVLKDQDLPLKLADVYNNTVYSAQRGIDIEAPAKAATNVVGNLIFSAKPMSGTVTNQSGNVVDAIASAPVYVVSPSFVIGLMSFYPIPGPGAEQGPPLDLSPFASQIDYDKDFNGTPKNRFSGKTVFRGAYAGEGINPGWKVQAGIKPELPQSRSSVATIRKLR